MANPIKASDLYQDDGALERAIKQLQQLSEQHGRVLADVKKEAIQLQVNVKKLNATTAGQREEIGKASKQADELAKRYQKYNDSLTENARQVAAIQEAQKKLNQINRAEARLNMAKEGSYNALSAQYSLLKLRLNQMTRAERDNTAEGRKMVKQARETYEEMKRLQEETGKTALNVGNYKESIKEALQETGIFPGVLGQVAGQLQAVSNALRASAAAVNANTKAMKFFKVALAATGIGAIVLVLGSLVAMLTRTQKGVDLVKRIVAGFNAVADVLVEKLASIGEALRKDFSGEVKKAGSAFISFWKDIFNRDYAAMAARVGGVANSVNDLANEMDEAYKKGKEYEKALQEINIQTIALETKTAKARAEIKALNLVAEDTTRSYADRAAAAERAGAIERALLEERRALLESELKVMEDRMNMTSDGLIDEAGGLEDVAKKRQEIAQVQTESLELQTTINNKLNTINDAARRSAAALNEELAQAAATLGGPAAEARLEYDKALMKIKELRDEAERLKQAFDFSPLKTLAAAQYERALDKILLSSKALALDGLEPVASSAAGAGDRLDEVRQIAGAAAERSKTLGDGLEITKEGADALKGAFGQAKAQVGEYFQQATQLADFQLQQAQQGVQAAQNELQIQLQLAQAGYANRVETAQDELALAKQKEEEAERQRQKAQRNQLIAQSVEQASNLITAVSKLFAELPFFLALPASATLFGTFAAAKIKAFQATRQFREGGYEELNYGGSHSSGNDIPLGIGSDGRERRAERGEALAVFSRKATGKYGGILPDLVQAINRGEFEAKYSALAHAADSLPIAGAVVNVNQAGVERRLDALRQAGQEKVYTDSQGRMVRVIGNRKITYV